ncbi:hypothetical protein EBU91_01685, partial [bacterium]|nr:hypothetical protein [bacterium]
MKLLSSLIKDQIRLAVETKYNQEIKDINIEFFKGSNFGHFSTSISFELSKLLKKNP